MLKKFFIATIMSVLVVVGQVNLCDAMPRSEMYLGRFTIGFSRDKTFVADESFSAMVRVYGQPTRNEHALEVTYVAHYGNTVEVSYSNYSDKIQSIEVTANNGWKTPSGLAVGMNISRALDMYGEPDYKKSGKFKTAYCYFQKTRHGTDMGFIILFNKDSGKILQLGVYGGSDMAGFDEAYDGIIRQMIQ